MCAVFMSLRSICGTQIGEFSIPLISQFIVEHFDIVARVSS